MFNKNYTKIEVLIDRIKRGKLFKELPHETAIDYAVDGLRLINSEKIEVVKPAKLKIEDFRAKLPDDFERMLQAVKTDEELKLTIPMRYGTDNFSSLYHCINSPDLKQQSDYTYILTNNYIKCNFDKGWVFLSYQGLLTDEEGTILIPDNVNVMLALEYYIKYKYLDDLGIIDDNGILNQRDYNEQQYCWYIGKAQSSINDYSFDEYEAFANSMSKFFDSEDYHAQFLRNLGAKEYIRNIRNG